MKWQFSRDPSYDVFTSGFSYSLSPRSRLVSTPGRAKGQFRDFLCCFLKVAVASAMCCLLFLFHSHSRFLRQRSVTTSYLHWGENMIMRRQMGSSSWTLISFSFVGDRRWNEFCANGNSWTTGVKFKYLAEENYHMVKVPDFGSGAFLKTFVWFVAWHLIFCTSSIKCGYYCLLFLVEERVMIHTG